MNYTPCGFDEDDYFGDEAEAAPPTEAQLIALAAYDAELAALAAVSERVEL